MDLASQQSIWNLYKQFSHDASEKDQRLSRNFFRRATPAQVIEFKNEFGPVLPEIYEKFLLEIGSGYLKQDANSKITISLYNEFLSLEEISSILRKETEELACYADVIDEGQVPFFFEFANSLFVLNKTTGEIHFPSFRDHKFADSFDEFLGALMADCEFYTNTCDRGPI